MPASSAGRREVPAPSPPEARAKDGDRHGEQKSHESKPHDAGLRPREADPEGHRKRRRRCRIDPPFRLPPPSEQVTSYKDGKHKGSWRPHKHDRTDFANGGVRHGPEGLGETGLKVNDERLGRV